MILSSMRYGRLLVARSSLSMCGSRFAVLLVRLLALPWVTAPVQLVGVCGFPFRLLIEPAFASLTSGKPIKQSCLMANTLLVAKKLDKQIISSVGTTRFASDLLALFARPCRSQNRSSCTGSVYTYFFTATILKLLTAEVEPLPEHRDHRG